jgi:DnaJ-class molecular chaperone
MVEYDIIYKKTVFSFNDLYQLGWDGSDRDISSHISPYILDGKITEMKYGNKEIIVNWEQTFKNTEQIIDMGITIVPCPVCNGEGSYDQSAGGHTITVDCNNCGKSGKVDIIEVI